MNYSPNLRYAFIGENHIVDFKEYVQYRVDDS
jgi:hypothetical protein